MPDQQQDMIRVGVIPSMIGAEGDAPIVVSIPRNTSPDQLQDVALAKARELVTADRRGTLAVENPMNREQKVGFDMPPSMEGEDASAILKAFPQLAGLIAQFTPAGRAGFKVAGAIPAGAELVRQAATGEDIDPMALATQFLGGVTGHGVGKVGRKVGDVGESWILKSLGLSGDAKTTANAAALPKVALRENAEMTDEGIGAIRKKATRRHMGPMGSTITKTDPEMTTLADVMENALLNQRTAPLRLSLWPNEAGTNVARQAPRTMAAGRAMAQPFGVGTREVVAPTAEAAVRTLLALASAMSGEGGQEPPLETSRGPRRRGGAQ